MDWDEQAATWDDEPGVRAYASGVLARVEAAFAGPETLRPLRVLDFGCGTGVLTEQLAGRCAAVVGLEPAPKMLAVLQAKVHRRGWSDVHPVGGTLESTADHPQLQRPFDLIVASSVCAFVPDYPATLAALAKLLRPGGLLMQFDWERDDTDDEPYGFARAEIDTALRAAGLQGVIVETGFSTPMGEMVMEPLLGMGRGAAGRSA